MNNIQDATQFAPTTTTTIFTVRPHSQQRRAPRPRSLEPRATVQVHHEQESLEMWHEAQLRKAAASLPCVLCNPTRGRWRDTRDKRDTHDTRRTCTHSQKEESVTSCLRLGGSTTMKSVMCQPPCNAVPASKWMCQRTSVQPMSVRLLMADTLNSLAARSPGTPSHTYA